MDKPPIVNCHTHIFTGAHVPPLLAKTFVPTPFHFLFPLGFFVYIFRWWYKGPAWIPYTVWYKKMARGRTMVFAFFNRLFPLNVIAGYYIFLFAFLLLYKMLAPVLKPDNSWFSNFMKDAAVFLNPFFPNIRQVWLSFLIVALVLFFFETIRNIIFHLARLLWKVISKIPGRQTIEMIRRYLNIGRYAFHDEQKTILSKLKSQYPKGTRFVVLPMDMDYMAAGKSKTRYRDQMQNLADVTRMPSNQNILYPFVFADPRRMVDVKKEKRYQPGDKTYFEWFIEDDKIRLGDCFMKDYLEHFRFSGIKIYPALGYYPFDKKLLPLWKYAADNNIPIMTHCIKGVIFYRGEKKDHWNEHPVFKQAMAKQESGDDKDKNADDGYKDDERMEKDDAKTTEYIPLVLSQFRNMDFSYNFTHPMNYLPLLEEELLRGLIASAVEKDPGTRLAELFGYSGPDIPLKHDLRNLKICMGHFGGDDEWKRYFEKDRYNYSSQLTKHPAIGIRFFRTIDNKPSPGKPEHIWKHTDWYSIICSMMLQYPQVYADISYILHSEKDILPLLKQTLQNPGLRDRVLYGTDFFVVRNHKSDKNMLADMTGGLSEIEFDQIARTNPMKYLENSLNPGN